MSDSEKVVRPHINVVPKIHLKIEQNVVDLARHIENRNEIMRQRWGPCPDCRRYKGHSGSC